MDRIDWLSPFHDKSAHHEDRLTWGLMVLLRYVPELQRFLRTLVARQCPSAALSETDAEAYWDAAEIKTQSASLSDQFDRLVSILLADEVLEETIPVALIDRKPIYDGVLEYPDGLTLIIENKLVARTAWKEQLSPATSSISLEKGEYTLFDRAVVLEWAEVLEGILRFVANGSGSFAEREFARDFLSFVERLHPALTPYRTFDLCERRPSAVRRRIRLLVESIASEYEGLVSKDTPGRDLPHIEIAGGTARWWRIRATEVDGSVSALRQHVWPGDTVVQARALLDVVDVARLGDLAHAGWIVRPNLHFSFMAKHLVWADSRLGVSDYLELFSSGQEPFGQMPSAPASLEPLLEHWVEIGLMRSADREDVRKHFVETNRETVNVIPGLSVHRDWPLEEIIALENESRLESECVRLVNEALACWGQSIAASSSPARSEPT